MGSSAAKPVAPATNGTNSSTTLTSNYDPSNVKLVNGRKRKLFVGCNWKAGLRRLDRATALVHSMNQLPTAGSSVELVVFPPAVFLAASVDAADNHGVGAQNIYEAVGPVKGATGSTTADMVESIGCTYVMVGHSDRRGMFKESSTVIAAKVSAALASGMSVNVTVGESAQQRDSGVETAAAVVVRQLWEALDTSLGSEELWSRVVVAYEPVWAIGEGATPCKPLEAQQIMSVIRRSIESKHGEEAAKTVRILYTGSVNPDNAAGFAKLPDCDGFILGRAGMQLDQLDAILKTLASTKPAGRRSSVSKKQEQVEVPDGGVIPGKARDSMLIRAGVLETHTALLERKSRKQSFDFGVATAESGEHVITHVHDGGPAADKLVEGDILTVVNGVDVNGVDHDDLVALLDKDVVATLVMERRIGAKELTRRAIGDSVLMTKMVKRIGSVTAFNAFSADGK